MKGQIQKHDIEFLYFSGMLESDNFRRDRCIARRKHKVREGDWFWITRRALDGSDNTRDYRVRVEYVCKYYVVLRYPAGFCEAAHWSEFERMTS